MKVIIFILNAMILVALSNLHAATQEEQQAACAQKAGHAWDSELNTCNLTHLAVETKEQHDECANAEDPDSCYMKTAQSGSGVTKGAGTGSSGGEMLAKTAAGAYSIFSAVGLRSKLSGKSAPAGVHTCMSKTIFMGTTAAWLLGDIFLKKSAKDRFKSLEEQYNQEASNDEQKGGDNGSYQSQVRAFAYLKQEQLMVKSQADNRAKLQLAVLLGYGASMAMAIVESIPSFGSLTACRGGTAEQAKQEGFKGQVVQTGTSPQIAVASGVMTAASLMLVKHANKQKGDADKNIAAIDEALATFANQMAGYCPDGREDLSNARCYCYTSSGQQNESRTNSAMCQNLWKADSNNFNIASTNYNVATGQAQVCLTKTGQVDRTCQCKNLIDVKTKENACSKGPYNMVVSGSLGSALNTPNTFQTLNSFSQGTNQALANLDSGQLSNSAAKTKKVLGSLIKQANDKGSKVPSLAQVTNKAQKLALKAATPSALAKYGVKRFNRASALPPAIATQLAKAKKEIAQKTETAKQANTTVTMTGGKALPNKAKNQSFKFNWSDSASGQPGTQVNQYSATKANKHLRASDITKKKSKSIFKIISRRYQVSGLRHLFTNE